MGRAVRLHLFDVEAEEPTLKTAAVVFTETPSLY
jgi:hypothetical protein